MVNTCKRVSQQLERPVVIEELTMELIESARNVLVIFFSINIKTCKNFLPLVCRNARALEPSQRRAPMGRLDVFPLQHLRPYSEHFFRFLSILFDAWNTKMAHFEFVKNKKIL